MKVLTLGPDGKVLKGIPIILDDKEPNDPVVTTIINGLEEVSFVLGTDVALPAVMPPQVVDLETRKRGSWSFDFDPRSPCGHPLLVEMRSDFQTEDDGIAIVQIPAKDLEGFPWNVGSSPQWGIELLGSVQIGEAIFYLVLMNPTSRFKIVHGKEEYHYIWTGQNLTMSNFGVTI
jgi:hypothetical protein